MVTLKKDKQSIQEELSELLNKYYDGSFARMVSEYHPCHGNDGSRSGCFIGGNEAFDYICKLNSRPLHFEYNNRNRTKPIFL